MSAHDPSKAITCLGSTQNIPIHCTINKLLSNGHIFEFSGGVRRRGDGADNLAEETVGDGENIGFMDDVEKLGGLGVQSFE